MRRRGSRQQTADVNPKDSFISLIWLEFQNRRGLAYLYRLMAKKKKKSREGDIETIREARGNRLRKILEKVRANEMKRTGRQKNCLRVERIKNLLYE